MLPSVRAAQRRRDWPHNAIDQNMNDPAARHQPSPPLRASPGVGHALAKRFLSWWGYPNVQGARHVPRLQRVCYVLDKPARSDVAMLDLVCEREGLPSPNADLALRGAARRAWSALNRRVGVVVKRYAHIDYPPALTAAFANDETRPLWLVPVTVFWGRDPGRERSLLRLLFSEHWSASGRLRRLIVVLLNRRDILVHFGEPTEVMALRTGIPPERALRRAVRLMRVQLRANRRAVLGPDLSHRRTMVNSIVRSPRVRAAIAQVTAAGDTPVAARHRAERYVREIASDMSYLVIRFFDLLLAWLWQRLYDGVAVSGVEDLRRVAATHTLVYVPSHRSHIDYLLLSYVLHHNGLMIPHIAAGENLNLPLVGGLLRRAGAFFLRRSFRDDPLYAAAFSEYLWHVFFRGHSIEYFVEGGRTRTGRLLDARPGLLAMTVEAVQRSHDRPLAFIPVYFGYERLFEDRSYLNELRGARKQKESLLDIGRALGDMRRSFGSVAVSFAPPLLLHEHLDALAPDWRTADLRDAAHAQLVPALGRAILEQINARAALNAQNLVALVVLATPKLTIAREALIEQIDRYLLLLRASPEGRYEFTVANGASAVQRTIASGALIADDDAFGSLVRYDPATAPLRNWYRNNVLHTLATPAVITALCLGADAAERDWLIDRSGTLRAFLASELHLASPAPVTTLVGTWLDLLIAQGLLVQRASDGRIAPPDVLSGAHAHCTLLARAITPALERYYTVASVLMDTNGPWTRSALVAHCLTLSQRLARLHGLDAPEFFDPRLFDGFVNAMLTAGWARQDEDGHLHYDHRMTIAIREGASVISNDFRNALWQMRQA